MNPDEANTVMWQMSSSIAVEFFKLCIECKATTEEEKTKVLIEMAKKGMLQRVWATKKSKEDAIKHLSKDHKVLRINPEER